MLLRVGVVSGAAVAGQNRLKHKNKKIKVNTSLSPVILVHNCPPGRRVKVETEHEIFLLASNRREIDSLNGPNHEMKRGRN